MSVEGKWNKGAVKRELARLKRKLGPQVDPRVAGVKCPDPSEHQFVTERTGFNSRSRTRTTPGSSASKAARGPGQDAGGRAGHHHAPPALGGPAAAAGAAAGPAGRTRE
jgi:hypothetical protein